MTQYLRNTGPRTSKTSQSEPMQHVTTPQVENSAGGFVWQVDPWTRLHRFLILGSEGGTYYVDERKLTLGNVKSVGECLALDGRRAIDVIVDVSLRGAAPKQAPTLYALAMACSTQDLTTRRYAMDQITAVCRTATMLFEFLGYAQQYRGWGRAFREAVADWYESKTPDELALQMVKYRNREGWTHRDVLRKAHPRPLDFSFSAEKAALYEWACGRPVELSGLPKIVQGFQEVQAAASMKDAAGMVAGWALPREALTPEQQADPIVLGALLDAGMPMTALIRNLGNLTKHDVIKPLDKRGIAVATQITNKDAIRKARVHPMTLLNASATYASGFSVRGSSAWTPIQQITDALDDAFYMAFENIEPTNKRFLIGLDVSGSMAHAISGNPVLSCRSASAALCLVTASVEPHTHIVAFAADYTGHERTRYIGIGYGQQFKTLGHAAWAAPQGHTARTMWGTGHSGLFPLNISPKSRLRDVIEQTDNLPFCGTDCALPMMYAQDRGLDVDCFVIYTDNETWFGDRHPAEALRDYRAKSGIDARLVVVSMTANPFSIADPDDKGMLDVVGFDTATPSLISAFAKGDI